MPHRPDLGTLGLPALVTRDTPLGPVHLSSGGGHLQWPAAFEVWGLGLGSLVGAPADATTRHFPVRLLTDGAEVDGELGPVVPSTQDRSVNRRTSASGLRLGSTLWSVRTTRLRTFVFERDGAEIATLRSGALSVDPSASATDHLAVGALLPLAAGTTLTSALLPSDGGLPLVPERPAPSWAAADGPEGTVADRLVRPAPGAAGVWIGSAAHGSAVWDSHGTAVSITHPDPADLDRPLVLTVRRDGVTASGSLTGAAPGRPTPGRPTSLRERLTRPARGIVDGARRLLEPSPLPEHLAGQVGSTAWEVRASGDLTRTVLRNGLPVATTWGPLLTADPGLGPADLAVAAALHRSSRFLRAPR